MNMANQEQIAILKQGAVAWNRWREQNPDINIDLSQADLYKADLSKTNFLEADLSGADLRRTNLCMANLSHANLTRTNFYRADLSRTNLSEAKLHNNDLRWAILSDVDLRGAELVGCSIYAISAWSIKLENTKQTNLIITDRGEPEITVDDLEVAQFIYLLLNNPKIREVIDTIAKKVVLILGNFASEQKAVLDALRAELRNHNYLPVVFDFERPTSRNLTETISTLAHMSRFIIADLTNARSIPQELERIVPHLPSVPIQPIIHIDATEYTMFEHYERYPWVLPLYRYQDTPSLLASIKEHILKPVEAKANEKEKTRALEEDVKNKDARIRSLEERIRMLEQRRQYAD